MRLPSSLRAPFLFVLATGCSASPAVVSPTPKPIVAPSVVPTAKATVDEDVDHDGIANTTDACPNDAEDLDAWKDEDGCPDVDDDGDKILDAIDKCPREPETYNGIDDADGCPDKLKIIINPPTPVIEYVRFVGSGTTVAPQSKVLLDEVAKVMNDHPEVELVEVEGHTDEQGSAVANVKLSQARAQAVVDDLVKRGVSATRLRAQGFGGYCPLDPAHTPDAWEKNRRANFKVVKKDGAPTGVATGCPEATAKGIVSAPVP